MCGPCQQMQKPLYSSVMRAIDQILFVLPSASALLAGLLLRVRAR
jgi:hypothetical protein